MKIDNPLNLTGKAILITRAAEQASEANELFKNNGAKVYEFPCLEIGPPKDWGPLDEAITELDSFDWVIYDSFDWVD